MALVLLNAVAMGVGMGSVVGRTETAGLLVDARFPRFRCRLVGLDRIPMVRRTSMNRQPGQTAAAADAWRRFRRTRTNAFSAYSGGHCRLRRILLKGAQRGQFRVEADIVWMLSVKTCCSMGWHSDCL